MKLLTFILLPLLSYNSFSQNTTKNCSVEESFTYTFSLQQMDFGGEKIPIERVRNVGSNECFSQKINQNSRYINYLLTNFTDRSNYSELLQIDDSIKIQEKFIDRLKNDNQFKAVMTQFLESENHSKDTIKLDELMNVAVKFFTINKITEEGYYSGKVCTGRNLLKSTEEKRLPQVEAFCFTSIFQNYMSNSYKLREKFVTAIKSLYKINLGIDEEDRLLRAQGALFIVMANDEDLKESLLKDYNTKSEYLPFILILE